MRKPPGPSPGVRVLDYRAMRELAAMRDDVTMLKNATRDLWRKYNHASAPAPKSRYMRAAELIPAGEDGEALYLYRRDRPNWRMYVSDHRYRVYNPGDADIAEGQEFWAGVDPWGDYYAIIGGGTTAAFFHTPAGGMAAAVSKFQPTFTNCERLYFNDLNGVIESATPPEFQPVGNHIETPVRESVVIQAKVIDGSYFIDVEPCE
jgi:hypothetical protein